MEIVRGMLWIYEIEVKIAMGLQTKNNVFLDIQEFATTKGACYSLFERCDTESWYSVVAVAMHIGVD